MTTTTTYPADTRPSSFNELEPMNAETVDAARRLIGHAVTVHGFNAEIHRGHITAVRYSAVSDLPVFVVSDGVERSFTKFGDELCLA